MFRGLGFRVWGYGLGFGVVVKLEVDTRKSQERPLFLRDAFKEENFEKV